MLPHDISDKLKPSSARRLGKKVRIILEVLCCCRICMSRTRMKQRKLRINKKVECLKSLFFWILITFCLFFVLRYFSSSKKSLVDISVPPIDPNFATGESDRSDDQVRRPFEGKNKPFQPKRPFPPTPPSDNPPSDNQNREEIERIDRIPDRKNYAQRFKRERKTKEKPSEKGNIEKPPARPAGFPYPFPGNKRDREPLNPSDLENLINQEGTLIEDELEDLISIENEEEDLTFQLSLLEEEKKKLESKLSQTGEKKVNYERMVRIQVEFFHSIQGYLKHALGHDEVRPETNQTNDSWGGFGITLIDSLDTMCLMDFSDLIFESTRQIREIDFNKDVKVSFFETTIRILGGLIGAYECTQDDVLLEKAVQVGDLLLKGFESPSGYPYHEVNLKTGKVGNAKWTSGKSILSEVGSIQLEFFALSQYTGNDIYYKTAVKAFDKVIANQLSISGLYPVLLNIDTGNFTDDFITIGGMGDSFYEYLLKNYLLTKEERFLHLYLESLDAIKENLVTVTENGKVTYLTNIGSKQKGNYFEHLECFFPGTLLLGIMEIPDKYYDNDRKQEDLSLARSLLNTCLLMYSSTETGLAPDSILINKNDGSFTISDPKFILRPETVESLYYMFKYTGENSYREIGWKIFENIEAACKTKTAYTGLSDVDKGTTNNSMQSFWLSETLKYFWLLFNEEDVVPFSTHVFSTEGHVFRRLGVPEHSRIGHTRSE